MPNDRVNVRCSAIVFRRDNVLLLRRDRPGSVDWVLPGGTPRAGESVASCTRREVAEETGLHVSVFRVAFVLEANNPAAGADVLDLVFTIREADPAAVPHAGEPGLDPGFYPVESLGRLQLRPPISGHIRALHAQGGHGTAAYLGNVWRPPRADRDE